MDQENNGDMSQNNNSGHVYTEGDGHIHEAAPVAAPVSTEAKAEDVSNQKLYAIIGYVLPFLFFLPLIQDSLKNNAYSRFHANQQLILLIVWVGIQIVLNNILYMVMGGLAFTLMPLVSLAILVLAIMGLVGAVNGEMKGLPLIGQFKILK